jgi:hypothetical protein
MYPKEMSGADGWVLCGRPLICHPALERLAFQKIDERKTQMTIIIIILLILILGGGGGYYGHSRWGYGGGAGIGLGTILVILLIAYLLGLL